MRGKKARAIRKQYHVKHVRLARPATQNAEIPEGLGLKSLARTIKTKLKH
jgi:hypothetical protein